MKFENNNSGNGGFITLSKDTEEVGRLTYTIFPEDKKLIIFTLIYICNFIVNYIDIHKIMCLRFFPTNRQSSIFFSLKYI